MSEDAFADRAAWILYANEPHPMTGEVPGFVPVGLYQTELEGLIQEMLEAWLSRSNNDEASDVLGRVVRRVHSIIDRDRAARGLDAVQR